MYFSWKKGIVIGGLCAAMLWPAESLAYNGVITGEIITYGQHNSGSGTFYQKKEVEKIADGVEHIKISKLKAEGWVDIHVLKVMPQAEGLALQTLRSGNWKQKETLKNMADQNARTVFGAV